MIDWVSIVRQSNRRFSNCMYFVPRSRRHRHKRERVLAHPATVIASEEDPADRSEHKCTSCFKVRPIDFFQCDLYVYRFFFCFFLRACDLNEIKSNREIAIAVGTPPIQRFSILQQQEEEDHCAKIFLVDKVEGGGLSFFFI